MPTPSTMHAVYVGDGLLLVHTAWGFHLYCPSQEMSIVPQLVISGHFELPLANFLVRHLHSGDAVLDIGANIGIFTVLSGYLVGEKGYVDAIEPVPHNIDLLQRNVMSNWLGDRVRVHPLAASDHAGEITVQTNARWGGLSSAMIADIRQMTRGVTANDSVQIVVPGMPVDALPSADRRWTVVKIDVEGYEYRVFQGMRKLLVERPPKAVVFECIAFRMQQDWAPFCDLLLDYERRGWTFCTLTDDSEHPVAASRIIENGYLYHVVMKPPADSESD